MSFGTSSSKSVMSEMNVTPLVDVMLVLLVVFIVTAPLLTPQAMKVKLPKTEVVAGATQEKKQVQLIVDEHAQLVWSGQPIDENGLAVQLKKMSQDPKAVLEIVADENAKYGKIAKIMALAQSSGVQQVALLTNASQSQK